MHYLIAWIALPVLVVAASLGVGLLVEQLTRLRLPNGVTVTVGFATSLAVPGAALPARPRRSVGRRAPRRARRRGVRGRPGTARRRAARRPDGARRARPVRPRTWRRSCSPARLVRRLHAARRHLGPLLDDRLHLRPRRSPGGADAVVLLERDGSGDQRSAIRSGSTTSSRACAGCSAPRSRASTSRSWRPRSRSRCFPAAQILRDVGVTAVLAPAGALVALAAYLPYSYSLQGGIKELGMITLVLLGGCSPGSCWTGAAGIARDRLRDRDRRARSRSISYGGLPWFGLMGFAAVAGYSVRAPRGLRAATAIARARSPAFVVGDLRRSRLARLLQPGQPAALGAAPARTSAT